MFSRVTTLKPTPSTKPIKPNTEHAVSAGNIKNQATNTKNEEDSFI